MRYLLCLLAITAFGQVDYPLQVKRPPALDTRTYQFTRTNGAGASGDLSATGSKTVTLTPCPAGITSASVPLSAVLVSGGTGTQEAPTLTAFSSGSGNCAISFTIANTHTGAWSIQSASSGIRECFITAGSGGACVTPAGTWNFYSPIYDDLLVSWSGTGNTSVIQQMFAGDGIIIGPTVYAGNFITIHDLKAVYGFAGGAPNFATSGALWTFRNLADGEVHDIESFLGFEGIKFFNSVRVKYSNLFSNANLYAFHWAQATGGSAGMATNLYGTVQNNGTAFFIEPQITGLTITNFLIEASAGSTGTYGIKIAPAVGLLLNELIITNGFVDNFSVSAISTGYQSTTIQSPGSTLHFSNIRFTSVGSQPTGLFQAPLIGLKISECTFYNSGSGDALIISGVKSSDFVGNHLDVATVSGKGLVIQSASGGEVVADVAFVANEMGFNGLAAPTLVIATDTAAHTRLLFSANKLNGALGWAATGSGNIFDLSNQFIPNVGFAGLPNFGNGSSIFCADCNSTCSAGSSTGRTCFRENNLWVH